MLQKSQKRKLAFVLAAADHGSMIVNRLDFHQADNVIFGVGFSILEDGGYQPEEFDLIKNILSICRQHRQRDAQPIIAVDCGANIGTHTLEMAQKMRGWGEVVAIEAQERVFYALAGNIALNNHFNARAIHAAAGSSCGVITIPQPDYHEPGSFGSLELCPKGVPEFMGQNIDYAANLAEIRLLTIDSLNLPYIDLLKIDVEGMEFDVLEGAGKAIAESRPVILIEFVKVGRDVLEQKLLDLGYVVFLAGMNFLAVHMADPILPTVQSWVSRIDGDGDRPS